MEHTLHQNKAIFAFNHAHNHIEVSSDVSSAKFYPLQVLEEQGEKVFMGFMVFPFFLGRKKDRYIEMQPLIFGKNCEERV